MKNEADVSAPPGIHDLWIARITTNPSKHVFVGTVFFFICQPNKIGK